MLDSVDLDSFGNKVDDHDTVDLLYHHDKTPDQIIDQVYLVINLVH